MTRSKSPISLLGLPPRANRNGGSLRSTLFGPRPSGNDGAGYPVAPITDLLEIENAGSRICRDDDVPACKSPSNSAARASGRSSTARENSCSRYLLHHCRSWSQLVKCAVARPVALSPSKPTAVEAPGLGHTLLGAKTDSSPENERLAKAKRCGRGGPARPDGAIPTGLARMVTGRNVSRSFEKHSPKAGWASP